jgi:hypothetical protein
MNAKNGQTEFERNYRYIAPPPKLGFRDRLAWSLGRDAGFARTSFRGFRRTFQHGAYQIFMDGYRAAVMVS